LRDHQRAWGYPDFPGKIARTREESEPHWTDIGRLLCCEPVWIEVIGKRIET
jgi:hypothetical protein